MERYRTTLTMLALLVVLGGLALFLNGRNTGTSGAPTPTPTLSIWQDTNPVIAIDVVSGTGKVSVRKDISTTSWMLTQPLQTEADTFAVSSIADTLMSPSATAQYTGTNNLADYGLDKQTMSVTATFSDTKGTKRILLVGKTTFTGADYYVKTADSPTVYVVSNSLIEPLRTWLTTPPVNPPTPTAPPFTVVVTGTRTLTTTSTITDSSTIIAPAPSPSSAKTAPAGVSATIKPDASPPGTGTAMSAPTGSIVPSATGGAPETPRPLASPVGGTPTLMLNATTTITGVSPITNTNTQPGAANPTTPLASPVVSPVKTP